MVASEEASVKWECLNYDLKDPHPPEQLLSSCIVNVEVLEVHSGDALRKVFRNGLLVTYTEILHKLVDEGIVILPHGYNLLHAILQLLLMVVGQVILSAMRVSW